MENPDGHKCLFCSRVYAEPVLAVLCEAIDEWEYASHYKAEYLGYEDGSSKRCREIFKEFLEGKERC